MSEPARPDIRDLEAGQTFDGFRLEASLNPGVSSRSSTGRTTCPYRLNVSPSTCSKPSTQPAR
jgi:hypothetical protein